MSAPAAVMPPVVETNPTMYGGASTAELQAILYLSQQINQVATMLAQTLLLVQEESVVEGV